MKKKYAFTIAETMIASGIFSMIMVICLSIVSAISWLLFTGQTETHNRSNLNETVYYITREIQSAESIRISEDNKMLLIKEHGASGYNLKYPIIEDYPVGYLSFDDKKMLDVDYDNSSFSVSGEMINVRLCTVKNNLDTNQKGKTFEFSVMSRSICSEEEE